MNHFKINLNLLRLAVGTSLMVAGVASASASEVTNHYLTVDGIKIFYREAGNPKNPAIVLLHGFPSSSHMFRDLIPLLADKYHVIAPDYPGAGYSDAPDAAAFAPTFEHLADVMADFIQESKIGKATYYVQDFGGPVGFRIAVKHPDWINGFIIQNANAYVEGLSQVVSEGNKKRAEKPSTVEELKQFELSPKLALMLYKTGARNPEAISPDSWSHCDWAMNEPGHLSIEAGLLNNYQTNIDSYPQWHEYFKKYQPRVLIVWGKGDPVFLPPGAEAYKKDLKNVELHFLSTSHFALEEDVAAVSNYIHKFMAKK